MKVSGETVTDEQIRALRKRTGWKGRAAEDQQTIAVALSTPKWIGFDAKKREDARALCAEMISARDEEITDLFDDLFHAKDKCEKCDANRTAGPSEALCCCDGL